VTHPGKIAALKKEIKHLKALPREAVGILQKYKNILVAQPEKPIVQKSIKIRIPIARTGC